MPDVLNRLKWPIAAVALVAIALVAVSCGNRSASEHAASATPADSTAPVEPPLTDANIAAIVVAANTIDIKNAEMAGSKTKDPAVKAFALRMSTDHTAANLKANALVTKLAMVPMDDAASRAMVSSADSMRTMIDAREGADFDKAYIDNEVTLHEAVIAMLDGKLIPGVTDPELKALLVAAKPEFEAHLTHAKQVQAALTK